MWEEDANKCFFEPDDFISPLIDLIYKHDMLLSLLKGIPMLQTPMGNWTRPNNIWHSNMPDNLIVCCDVVSAIHPPMANHLPIMAIIDPPLPHSKITKLLNFKSADWLTINATLATKLEAKSPARHIKSNKEFNTKVNNLVQIITDVLEAHLNKSAQTLSNGVGGQNVRKWYKEHYKIFILFSFYLCVHMVFECFKYILSI
jgi:hypothetical protein